LSAAKPENPIAKRRKVQGSGTVVEEYVISSKAK
jgi:hypothetical protein